MMPIYNAPLLTIDHKEARRYAGLMTAKFDEQAIDAACEEALLLAEPHGIWNIYEYDSKTHIVQNEKPFQIKGSKITAHLNRAEKVIILAATVGETIEKAVTRHFSEGRYAYSVLLDAAATTAVEQIADAIEKAIQAQISAKGYTMRWRFSPGYGDWGLDAQPEMLRLSDAPNIGISLTESLMLYPRKSITAIIGLVRENNETPIVHLPHDCAACDKTDCISRKN
jgi:hypothetical protein